MRETYLISYDIKDGDNQIYSELYEYIKSHGTWSRITESLWAIKTNKSAPIIRNEIKELLPENSRIMVIRSGTEAAWSNVICRNKWLKENL